MDQLMREFGDVISPELFKSYHKIGATHLYDRHLTISHKDLKERLRYIPFDPNGDMVKMTRFFEDSSLQDVLKLIYECLVANEKDIREWLKTSKKSEDFVLDFDSPIGEGIVKGSDWNVFHPASKIVVVLGESSRNGRLFEIITAYPDFNWDEIDEAWDAIDAWQEKAD